jgi:uncharacterized membrane protein YfcA
MAGVPLALGGWAILVIAGFILGIAKGGLPAASILAIPLIALVVPGKTATGLILPILILGDLFALAYWRRSASWKDLGRALPWAIAGIAAGMFFLGRIDDRLMRPIIGAIVLGLLAIHIVRQYFVPARLGPAAPVGRSGRRFFAATMGCLGGFTTMLANAGGAVMSIYFLALGLSKDTFIGTSAWFFFIVNLIKLPLMMKLGMITGESLGVNLAMLPALAAGTAAGIFIARRLDQKVFDITVSVLTAIACIRLIF